MGISGVAGRHHAVEHIDPSAHPFNQIFRLADPHQVAWFILRQQLQHKIQNSFTILLRFTYSKTADGIPVEADLKQRFHRFTAQLLVYTALDNTKQSILIIQSDKFILGTFGPAHRKSHRAGGIFQCCRIWSAFIKTHYNIRTDGFLYLH